jgi:hypothetical protein
VKRAYAYGAALFVAGAVVLAIQIAVDPRRALFAYTAGFDFGITIAVGALMVLMIMNAAHASWFVALRRPVEAIAGTLPLFVVLLVPVVLGLRSLYPWMHPDDYPDPVRGALHHERWLLNPAFFVVRAYAYVVVWLGLGLGLRAVSVRQDSSPEYRWTVIQRVLSAAALPVMAVTLSLAAFDWFMSLVAGFYSDIFGMYVFCGAFYGGMGAIAIACAVAYRAGRFPRDVGPPHFLSIGRVMLVSTILWAYIGFAQLLLIWIANLPREVTFYVQRTAGAWSFFSGVQLFGHFVLAFLLLLSRALKLEAKALAWVGGLLVVMHGVDVYWLVVPSDRQPSVLDFGAFLAVAGLMFMFGAWRFARRPPVPVNDPYLPRALAYESP